MRFVALIPARGGSKGIPGKNLRQLGGRPLLAYSAETALECPRIESAVLSTDSEEIADLGRRLGLRVPFLRPAELARDDTPMLPVVQHALRRLSADGTSYDAVVLLQPTSPNRSPQELERALELFARDRPDSLVSVRPVPHRFNPHWVFFRDTRGRLAPSTGGGAPVGRRQDLPSAWHRDGAFYVTRTAVVLDGDSLYGDECIGFPSDVDCFNLDDEDDWRRAERRLRRGSEFASREPS